MTQNEKIAFVRDELPRFANIQDPACSEVGWIMLKLSCSERAAEKLIAAARAVSAASTPQRPRLTAKVLDGLIELAIYAEAGEPADLLGQNPEQGDTTEERAELRRRWAQIEAACRWVRGMQAAKVAR